MRLSATERRLLRHLASIESDTSQASYDAIAAGARLSTTHANRLVHRLEELGLVKIDRLRGRRSMWSLTPAGRVEAGGNRWWCLETENLKGDAGRSFQPLTLCFDRGHAPRLAQELMAQPDRKARWARVVVTIEEV